MWIGVRAMGESGPSLQDWIGRTETREEVIGLERARAMHAALDRGAPEPADGDPLPPLWHWLYFWIIAPRSGLGRDGHPALGGFMPPVGTARRMWAGNRIRFLSPLRIGEPASRISTISSVSEKTGRTGRLVFVTVRHELTGGEGRSIVDEHDIVYREDSGPGVSGRPGEPAPQQAAFSETVTPDPTLLFRYSALTFNGHRIHYDRDYAMNVEGYGGLVVHGPLLATMMIDLAVRSWRERTIASFEFRGQRPIIDTAPFTVHAQPEDADTLALWIVDAGGALAMKGKAAFR